MRAKVPYRKNRKRVGRGTGSGHGKTATRGVKGQKSRSGVSFRPGFEGGQNPLYRRIPKRGFNNAEFTQRYAIVNLDRIAKLSVSEVDPELLLKEGIVKKLFSGIKILGDGEISKAVIVKAHRFTQSAKDKIEKAGGQAILIEKKVAAEK